MAFDQMASGNPFGTSDMSTPLIDAEHGSSGATADGSYKSAIRILSKSLGSFQQQIDKASNLTRRIGTNRDNQKVRDQIRAHIEEGRSLIQKIGRHLKDFQRFVSEVSGSERVSLNLFVSFHPNPTSYILHPTSYILHPTSFLFPYCFYLNSACVVLSVSYPCTLIIGMCSLLSD
jgi:hypothetical protein